MNPNEAPQAPDTQVTGADKPVVVNPSGTAPPTPTPAPTVTSAVGQTEVIAPIKPAAPQTKSVRIESLFELVFRVGFASIFLINSLNALVKPGDFTKLLEANPISGSLGHDSLFTTIIAINDGILGILILTGWKKKYVWAWAGIWLILVAGIKTFYLA